MKIYNYSFFFLLIISITANGQSYDKNVVELISKLTLEEKVKLVVGTATMPFLPPEAAPGTPVKPPIPDGTDFSTFFSDGKVAGSAGESFSIPKLNIPSVVYADGPAGLRINPTRKNTTTTFFCTAFPVASLLASSWDEDLLFNVGKAMGNETHEYGVDVLLAPGINIMRNPLTGRNFEYYSEDPIVTGKLAAAMVKGIQSEGVGTSVKHFAVNNQETFRNGVDAILSERALREIYLKSFSIVVKEANPWTIMSSYNKINGVYASESHGLLTEILRNEWGYKGFVMTDWWAEHDPVQQLKAGNDLLMPGHPYQIKEIVEAIKLGIFEESELDKNVAKILEVMFRTPSFLKYKYSNAPDLAKHAEIARQAATEGMVLLKNNNSTLPLNYDTKLALFGNASYDIVVGGTGSGNVNRKYKVSLADALKGSSIKIDEKLQSKYQTYLESEKEKLPPDNFWSVSKIEEFLPDKNLIASFAENNDFALLTIGRISGEGSDRKLQDDYYLSDSELLMVTAISEAFHKKRKKVIVVLNIGGVIETVSWRDYADAILFAGQPGQEGGNSIADIVTGKINPSGKLAVTFPLAYNDVPSSKNFPSTDNNPSIVKYLEDIYVGYRYYSTFNVKTAYEFGFGLSFTKFKYSNLAIDQKVLKNKVQVSIKVTNTGRVAGKEVIQLYISSSNKSFDKPSLELKKFAKTKLLQPGASQVLVFELKAEDFASFDTLNSAWIVEAGQYEIKLAASSKNIFQTKTINVEKDIIVQKVKKVLAPEVVLPKVDFKRN